MAPKNSISTDCMRDDDPRGIRRTEFPRFTRCGHIMLKSEAEALRVPVGCPWCSDMSDSDIFAAWGVYV